MSDSIQWQPDYDADDEHPVDGYRPLKTGFSKDAAGNFTIHHTQDVEFSLKVNRSLYAQNTRPNGSEWHHIARIEPGIAYMWEQLYGVQVWNPEHHDAMMSLIHDPQWLGTRVAPGEYRKRPDRQHFSAASSPMALLGKKRES